MSQAHGDHCGTPQYHYDGDEDAGTEAFEEDIGQGFEKGVGDEEDGQAGIVLAAGDVEAFLEAIKPGVAYVGTIEEGDQVEKT